MSATTESKSNNKYVAIREIATSSSQSAAATSTAELFTLDAANDCILAMSKFLRALSTDQYIVHNTIDVREFLQEVSQIEANKTEGSSNDQENAPKSFLISAYKTLIGTVQFVVDLEYATMLTKKIKAIFVSIIVKIQQLEYEAILAGADEVILQK